jgi:tRNA G46 methylase TrmB
MSVSSYEEKPYATFALQEAELRRLAAMARLHGVDVASPEKCSVLEIGCGTGMNLLPLAERYPESRFV